MLDCKNEQAAARELGWTRLTWDEHDEETQPASENKKLDELSARERVAAAALGFSPSAWDNDSGSELQPASEAKSWAELTTCGGENSCK